MVKGNDGKASRSFRHKIWFLIIGTFVLLGLKKLKGRFGEKSADLEAVEENAVSNNKRRDIGRTKPDRKGVDRILSADVHLIDIRISHVRKEGYSVVGTFCELDWSLQKADPSTVPMFKVLIAKSPRCQKTRIEHDIKTVVKRAREYDDREESDTLAIPSSGFVFQESRCGSTLVANSLAAVDPQKHRVYSESGPPVSAAKVCESGSSSSCDQNEAVALLRDVVYLMGRTNDPDESRLFFKIQSIGAKSIHRFREAFPKTPWIFVYREPVQVMMSHLGKRMVDGVVANEKDRKRMQGSVCMRLYRNPTPDLHALVKLDTEERKKLKDLSTEEFCAAHLATLCESALKNHKADPDSSVMVNYADIPNALLNFVFPDHFNIPVTAVERQRVNAVCDTYSKGGDQKREWVADSETKEKNASREIKKGAAMFLNNRYERLRELSSAAGGADIIVDND